MCNHSQYFRWVEYHLDNARGENRLRHYRRTLNGIGISNLQGVVPPGIAEAEASAAVVCSFLCFVIVEWHQFDRVVLAGMRCGMLVQTIDSIYTIISTCVHHDDLPIHHLDASELYQPEGSDLPKVRPHAGGGRGRGWGRGRGRGRRGGGRGRQGNLEVIRDRDYVNLPVHVAEPNLSV
ncbi:hypothetical protein AHAS_Ahas06G0146000 [Arachis hypogaea]